jgi:hypothetical protein
MFKLAHILSFILFEKLLLNDNYFFSYAFKFEKKIYSSIFFFMFVWMNFIFKNKKILSDNIFNMCSIARCVSFLFILFDQFNLCLYLYYYLLK